MIIVQLMGGLGNQMFQYATARALAIRNEAELKLDTSEFGHYPLRCYKLSLYQIVEEFATQQDLRLYRWGLRNKLASRVLRWAPKLRPLLKSPVLVQHQYNFEPYVIGMDGDMYLVGIWQSEKYFKDVQHVIRTDLVLKTPLEEESSHLAETIQSTADTVSVHVRRGDYVTDPEARVRLGLCPLEYYSEAISKMVDALKDPHFFLFSDDPEWVRSNLKIDFPTHYVDHNPPERDYEDLRLMSLCSHHIIANSSFSWWGAWLSDNPSKMVIAPNRWFADPRIDDRDLIPNGWMRM